MRHYIARMLALIAVVAVPLAVAANARSVPTASNTPTCFDSTQMAYWPKPKLGDSLLVVARTKTTVCARPLHAVPPVVTPPPATSGEPVYTPGVGTLVFQDNMDRYASTTAMGAYPFVYTGPVMVPEPSPNQQSQPVDVTHTLLVTGRGGVGKALEMKYDGVYQESHNFATANLPVQPIGQANYITHYARVTLSAGWTSTTQLSIKWLMGWHIVADNTRIQWNTHYPTDAVVYPPVGYAQTVWEILDQKEVDQISAQPVGPSFFATADGQWHRFTYAYRSHSSLAALDGFAKMWIDGQLMLDVEKATVGVTPPGGVKPWCTLAELQALAVGDGIAFLKFGGPQTTPSPPWVYDIDDLTWWRQ